MRLTTKIATSGVSGLSRFPTPRATFDECLGPDGRLDMTKARVALDCEQIQVGSNDDLKCLAFTFEYLRQMRSVANHLDPDNASTKEVPLANAPRQSGETRCERNMRKGRYAYCRTDITSCQDGIHVKLSVQNPKEVVGVTENFARMFAIMCARILLYLKDNISTTTLHLIEGEGAKAIYEEAFAEEEKCALARKRKSCRRLKNGCYCSPIDVSCPLYCNGKCKEP